MKICVYCSSSSKIEKKYFDCTKELAKEFLKENVEVNFENKLLRLKGPKGMLEMQISNSVDVKIVDNSNSDADLGFLIKNAPIPVGSSLELIDGGSKVVVQQHDEIQAKSSINNSLDVIVSAVDAIST